MRISKKDQQIRHQILNINNMERHESTTVELYMYQNLGPDIYCTKALVESLVSKK
ncbi:hypothetical protein [Desulfuribacillus stibiiarsenatis]|uniref:hypothetical protein n=1 Tax=Desulfuribacillus stibiiarsenatis TaxID=1390249 RepID=UPI00159EF6CF|nr:hypothetical protein [Desulfuribacillus stibiiarsenatis]